MSAQVEEDRPEGAHSSADEEVYRYGPFYRTLAYGAVAIGVFVFASAVLVAITSGLADVNWGAYAGAVAGLVGVGISFPTLLSELHLTADRLRKEWPLRPSREVRLRDVSRVFIGGSSVELYVSPGADPALTFDRKVRGSEDLIETLVGHLPASAGVDHPSGEMDELLEDRFATE